MTRAKRRGGRPAGSLRVGLVGAGNMGSKHARVIASLANGGVAPAAVFDSDLGRAEALHRQAPGFAVAGSLEELAASCEAVIVAAPTSEHYAITRRLLEAGRHVLLEKPATADPELFLELDAEAARHGTVLEVGFVERHNPAVRELVSRLKGAPVLGFEARRLGAPGRETCHPPTSIIWDLMIHDVDILLGIAGPCEVKRLATVVERDWAVAALSLSGGTRACLQTTYLSQDKVRQVRVFTPEITYDLDCLNHRLLAHSCGEACYEHGAYLQSTRQETVVALHGEPLRLQDEAFFRKCLGEPTQSPSSYVAPGEVLRFMTCLERASVRENGPVLSRNPPA